MQNLFSDELRLLMFNRDEDDEELPEEIEIHAEEFESKVSFSMLFRAVKSSIHILTTPFVQARELHVTDVTEFYESRMFEAHRFSYDAAVNPRVIRRRLQD